MPTEQQDRPESLQPALRRLAPHSKQDGQRKTIKLVSTSLHVLKQSFASQLPLQLQLVSPRRASKISKLERVLKAQTHRTAYLDALQKTSGQGAP